MSDDHESGQWVFDPRGIVEAEPQPLAARAESLKGLRLGVLDNTKWNARTLLESTMDTLNQEFGFAAMNYYRKEGFSLNADPDLIARISAENDVVLIGIGD